MKLSSDDKAIAGGEWGAGPGRAMEYLVRFGEAVNANRMVRVNSAHIGTVSYRVLGDAGFELCSELAKGGSKVRVLTTTNPGGYDDKSGHLLRLKKDFVEGQRRLIDPLRRMGVTLSYSCIPYWMTNVPKIHDRLVWAESNAAAYANSVVGARSNREAGIICLLSAICGRTPEYGLLTDEPRLAQVLVRVRHRISRLEDFRALGALVGKWAFDRIPGFIFEAQESALDTRALQALGGAMCSPWGNMAIFHVIGETPEAPTLDAAFGGRAPQDELVVGQADVQAAYGFLSTASNPKVDLVTLGSPYYGLEDLEKLAALFAGKRVHMSTQCWVTTDDGTKLLADRMGYVDTLSEAGVELFTQTCLFQLPIELIAEAWNFRTAATDSAKYAAFIPGVGKPDCWFGTMEECVEAAVTGYWKVKRT